MKMSNGKQQRTHGYNFTGRVHFINWNGNAFGKWFRVTAKRRHRWNATECISSTQNSYAVCQTDGICSTTCAHATWTNLECSTVILNFIDAPQSARTRGHLKVKIVLDLLQAVDARSHCDHTYLCGGNWTHFRSNGSVVNAINPWPGFTFPNNVCALLFNSSTQSSKVLLFAIWWARICTEQCIFSFRCKYFIAALVVIALLDDIVAIAAVAAVDVVFDGVTTSELARRCLLATARTPL